MMDKLLNVFDKLDQEPMTPQYANAMCNVTRNVCTLYNMQQKFGKANESDMKTLKMIQ